MKMIKTFAFVCCVLLLDSHASFAQPEATRFIESRYYGCDLELSLLNRFLGQLQTQPELRGYVIVYAAREGSRVNTALAYGERMKKYLTISRDFDDGRVTVVDGGFRERLSYELWLAPPGAEPPEPTPTVSKEMVKMKRGRIKLRRCGAIPD
jgi:hypothetical protein